MDFVFCIPDRIEELEDRVNFDRYYLVEATYQPNRLEAALSEADERYRAIGTDFILETFDIFFSVIKHFPVLDASTRDKAWNLLNKALIKFQGQLCAFFENNFQLEQRLAYQNKLQMILYLFLTISSFFENDDLLLTSVDFDAIGETAPRGRKKKTAKQSQIYQTYKFQCLKSIHKIFRLNLDRLFEPAHFLNSFVNIVTKYVYKLLENYQANNLLRSSSATIFQELCGIMDAALEKYNYSANYCMKIIELLQAKESLVGVLAQLVTNNLQAGHKILISDILMQIKAIDISILSRDNSAPKAISTFLVELSKLSPQHMYQNLSYLVEFLEQDSYMLRNAVLEIICNIIIEMFASPAKNRDVQIKNKLLNYLFEHIHDVNSYTRSKVLQLWSKLAEHETIPMTRLNAITQRIVNRLDDKSCFVRKNAIHFLTQTIKDNPFTILSKRELGRFRELFQKAYDEFSEKLQTLQRQQSERFEEIMKLRNYETGDDQVDDNEDDDDDDDDDDSSEIEAPKKNLPTSSSGVKRKSSQSADTSASKRQRQIEKLQALANEWLELEKKFIDFWRKNGDKLDLTESIPDDIPQDNIESAFEHFRSLVIAQKFEEALRVLISLKSLYPNEKLFEYRLKKRTGENVENDDDGDDESEDDDDSFFNNNFFDFDDHLFLSSITDFANDFNTKLPYELDLARLIFLAPVINFGKAEIDPDDMNSRDNRNQTQNLSDLLQQHSEELESNQANIEYYEKALVPIVKQLARIKDAEKFIDLLSEAIPKICYLLQSRNIVDVQEAINFFTFAFKLDLANAIVGVQKMLKLIFTKEKAIKDRLMEAFVEIYLNESFRNSNENGSGVGGENRDQSIENEVDELVDDCEESEVNQSSKKQCAFKEIRNLSNMILRLNQGELVCAEALIQEIYLSRKFTKLHLQILWERYAMKLRATNADEARAALIIIGMLASAHPNLIQNDNSLNNLIKISLEDRCDDYRLVADTCEVLIRAFRLPNTESGELFFKLQPDHRLFERLQIILIDSITNTENKYWNRLSSGIIKVIYFYAEKPDPIVSRIIEYTFKKMINMAKRSVDEPVGDSSEQQQSQSSTIDWAALCSQKSENTQSTNEMLQRMTGPIDDMIVARFFSILGDVAMMLLIHLDMHLMREIKIRQYIEDKENQKKKDSKKSKAKNATENKRASRMSKRISIHPNEDDDDMADEMLGPTSNEDPMQELVTKTCDQHILFGNGILSKFTTIIERIAADYEGNDYSLTVRVAASVALAKFMALSLRFTREKRTILAGLLERSKDWEIRSNAIISFGDLLVRFPNEFEHFTGRIFSCLCDENFTVKSNALKVLTRLILADMIKPKGQISKIARLVTDSDVVIKDLAQLFFIELGKKNNVYIYNYLPDIISHLSGSNGMEEEQFHEMIKFLFERLEKTRNTESLITKLCYRFRESNDERTWCDLSFCLSQLNYNDRALLNLSNHFQLFAETLCHDAVSDNIFAIIATARKPGNLKNETKGLLDELENKIKDIKNKSSI